MQVVQIDKARRGARKSGHWSRAPRLRGVRPGLAAILAGVVAVAALAATLLARPGGGEFVTIPGGTALVALLDERLSTTESEVGQPVALQTREPLRLSEEFTLPAGIIVRGQVIHSSGGSDGVPELAVGFTEIEIAGERYGISAEPFRIRGPNPAVKGRPQSGGPGDAPNQAGTDGALIVTGDQIVLPAGQRIRILLSEPISVRFNGSRTTHGG